MLVGKGVEEPVGFQEGIRLPAENCVILQAYLRPSRRVLFESLQSKFDGELDVLLYGRTPAHRRSLAPPDATTVRCVHLKAPTVRVSYRNAFTVPIGLRSALDRLAPGTVVAGWNLSSMKAAKWAASRGRRFAIWSEETRAAAEQRPLPRSREWMRRRVLQLASLGLAAGAESADYFRLLGFDGPVRLVPNAIAAEDDLASIPLDSTRGHQTDSDELHFLFSGALLPIKGIDLLVRNWTSLTGNLSVSSHLHIAGEGPMRPEIEEAARRDPNIHYYGFVRGAEYVELFARCDVMIIPSRLDCNPLVVIEALWAGLPLILSRKAGNWPEALRGNGFMIDPQNLGTVREAIEWIAAASTVEMSVLRTRSRQLASWYSLDRAASEFAAALNEPGQQ